MVGTWMYWVLGTYNADFDQLALTAALLRSGESLGSTCSYGVGASSSASLMTNLIVAAVVWFVGAPTATYSAWIVTDEPAVPLGLGGSPDVSIYEQERDSKTGGISSSIAVV